MSLKDLKVTDEEFSSYGVISQPDTLTGTPEENKAVFDALIRRVSIEHINKLIDELSTSGAADMGTEPFDAVTATTVQAALEQIYALIGSTYSGTDGAGKVGFSGTSSIQASNVQAAIEAVQANLAALIALLKSQQGAAQVGNAPIAGLTATTVQAALAELRDQIQDIVAGSIPSQSVTTEQIQDGAVTAEKIGFTGEDIPTSDTDSTSISSQLSNALRRTGNQTVDGIIASRSSIDHAAYASVTGTDAGGYLEWYKSFETYYKRSQLILGPPVDDAMPQLLLSQTFDGVHFDSVMVATATPPQEFDLPLAEGFSKHYCASYCKTQDGMVTVSLWIVGSGAANVETTIATLPEGFRPTELFRAEGIVDNGTIPSQNQCGITVNEYGQIAVQAKSAWGYVSSIFTFRAAD